MGIFKRCGRKLKQIEKSCFDHHNRVHQLPNIPDNTDVWVTRDDRPTRRQVVSTGDTPRSNVVNTPSGTVRQNRSHLRVVPSSESESSVKPSLITRVIMT